MAPTRHRHAYREGPKRDFFENHRRKPAQTGKRRLRGTPAESHARTAPHRHRLSVDRLRTFAVASTAWPAAPCRRGASPSLSRHRIPKAPRPRRSDASPLHPTPARSRTWARRPRTRAAARQAGRCDAAAPPSGSPPGGARCGGPGRRTRAPRPAAPPAPGRRRPAPPPPIDRPTQRRPARPSRPPTASPTSRAARSTTLRVGARGGTPWTVISTQVGITGTIEAVEVPERCGSRGAMRFAGTSDGTRAPIVRALLLAEKARTRSSSTPAVYRGIAALAAVGAGRPGAHQDLRRQHDPRGRRLHRLQQPLPARDRRRRPAPALRRAASPR